MMKRWWAYTWSVIRLEYTRIPEPWVTSKKSTFFTTSSKKCLGSKVTLKPKSRRSQTWSTSMPPVVAISERLQGRTGQGPIRGAARDPSHPGGKPPTTWPKRSECKSRIWPQNTLPQKKTGTFLLKFLSLMSTLHPNPMHKNSFRKTRILCFCHKVTLNKLITVDTFQGRCNCSSWYSKEENRWVGQTKWRASTKPVENQTEALRFRGAIEKIGNQSFGQWHQHCQPGKTK